MEKLLELDDITLLPSLTNSGAPGNKAIFTVSDPLDNSGIVETLPIFTSPMEAIVGENSAKIWSEYGIRPVNPGILSNMNAIPTAKDTAPPGLPMTSA
jgi:hypothetical protein